MYCMHCGKQIADNSRYCKYCGKLVAEDEIRTVKSGNEEDVNIELYGQANSEIAGVTEPELTSDDEIPEEKIETSAVKKEKADFVDMILDKASSKNNDDEVIEDFFFAHVSKKKKIALFMLAVFVTAIIAAIVFAAFFPNLI